MLQNEQSREKEAFGMIGSSALARQTSKGLIREKINYHREILMGLERLEKLLPEDLDVGADQALWRLIAGR